jgi:hypothetical protein
MEKFTSQQAALRTALKTVLGTEPVKYQLEISPEQRTQVGELMMGWLKQDLWSIRPGTRAATNPLNYIVGTGDTCLIQAWMKPRPQKSQATFDNRTAAPPTESKFDLIKKALDAGLITKEQAAEAVSKLLG